MNRFAKYSPIIDHEIESSILRGLVPVSLAPEDEPTVRMPRPEEVEKTVRMPKPEEIEATIKMPGLKKTAETA
jgi:hypothetical protein